MLYRITDGTVSLGGETVLSHIDFEIRGNEKIAVVGRNGAGKTTLLRLVAGELRLDRDDKRPGPGIDMSRKLTTGMLRQQPEPEDRQRTVEEILLAGYAGGEPDSGLYSRERYDGRRERGSGLYSGERYDGRGEPDSGLQSGERYDGRKEPDSGLYSRERYDGRGEPDSGLRSGERYDGRGEPDSVLQSGERYDGRGERDSGLYSRERYDGRGESDSGLQSGERYDGRGEPDSGLRSGERYDGRGEPDSGLYSKERYDYEKESDRIFTGFGFHKEDKYRRLSEFSGGEQTKIMMIRLLLEKPDILLLDEPTNHLDLAATEWLEDYIRGYPNAVVMVSHDRFFLDRTAEVVYELTPCMPGAESARSGTSGSGRVRAGSPGSARPGRPGCRLTRYSGTYTEYRQEKAKRIRRAQKDYEQQQAEIARLNGLIERFKNKPGKAAFARSRKKILERMVPAEKPEADDVHRFTVPITPAVAGSKWVLEAEHLKIGYGEPLLELSIRIRKGQKVGVLGPNGAGKTTFLRTAAGYLPPLSGNLKQGARVSVGYFDQHSAEIASEKTVAEHFHDLFPALTEKEARQILGDFLFGGRAAQTKVSDLSGGEKARLVLAELLQSRPNFLILDEPTNHMDIQAKETLESAFRAYEGTILFVSHDRYFLKQVADCMLIFENGSARYYPFGYEHYLERLRKGEKGDSVTASVAAEDQALLAGIRAVPREERHRLREIPEEEAYADWRMRLAGEKLARAETEAAESFARLGEAREAEYVRWAEGWAEEGSLSGWFGEAREAEYTRWAAGQEAAENPGWLEKESEKEPMDGNSPVAVPGQMPCVGEERQDTLKKQRIWVQGWAASCVSGEEQRDTPEGQQTQVRGHMSDMWEEQQGTSESQQVQISWHTPDVWYEPQDTPGKSLTCVPGQASPMGEERAAAAETADAYAAFERACAAWHEACMEWYDAWEYGRDSGGLPKE